MPAAAASSTGDSAVEAVLEVQDLQFRPFHAPQASARGFALCHGPVTP